MAQIYIKVSTKIQMLKTEEYNFFLNFDLSSTENKY